VSESKRKTRDARKQIADKAPTLKRRTSRGTGTMLATPASIRHRNTSDNIAL